MTLWQRWVLRPQSLWVRKVLFQVHLWVGVGIGVYVLAISISGSAIVFRQELGRMYTRKTVVLSDTSRSRMSAEEVEKAAQRTYPGRDVLSVLEPSRPDRADRVELALGRGRIERLFDPYTGADLGDPESGVDHGLEWLTDLHDNLLSGPTGRFANGMGALLLTVLSLTGAVLWWPGVQSWRRSTTVNWNANLARLNWDLHSAIGFWCSLFLLVWGVSGIYLCFPGASDFLLPGQFRFWITRLHFGRFDWLTETLWTVFGIAPAILAATGALMWWNRVLRKKLRRLT